MKNRNHIHRFSIRLSLDEILIRALMIQPKNNYFSGSSRHYRFSNIISACFIWPSFKLITSFIVNSSPLLELLSKKACLFCNKVPTKCCFFKQMYLLLYQSIHEIHTIGIIKATLVSFLPFHSLKPCEFSSKDQIRFHLTRQPVQGQSPFHEIHLIVPSSFILV